MDEGPQFEILHRGQCVFRFRNGAGAVFSCAAPVGKPWIHRFLHGRSLSPFHEHELGDALRKSKNLEGFISTVRAAGYEVRRSKGGR
jgi:hypothetical protein